MMAPSILMSLPFFVALSSLNMSQIQLFEYLTATEPLFSCKISCCLSCINHHVVAVATIDTIALAFASAIAVGGLELMTKGGQKRLHRGWAHGLSLDAGWDVGDWGEGWEVGGHWGWCGVTEGHRGYCNTYLARFAW